MLHGVGSIRSPTLGERHGASRLAITAELLECVTDTEVARHEGIGVAQPAHSYVLSRPRPDARQCQQSTPRVRAIRPAVDHQLAARERSRQCEQAAPPGGRHRQLRGIYAGQRLGRREDVCHRP